MQYQFGTLDHLPSAVICLNEKEIETKEWFGKTFQLSPLMLCGRYEYPVHIQCVSLAARLRRYTVPGLGCHIPGLITMKGNISMSHISPVALALDAVRTSAGGSEASLLPYVKPFTATADSVLMEDYIGSTDLLLPMPSADTRPHQIAPFTNPATQLPGAAVIVNGHLNALVPDAANPGGYQLVDSGLFTDCQEVAAARSSNGAVFVFALDERGLWSVQVTASGGLHAPTRIAQLPGSQLKVAYGSKPGDYFVSYVRADVAIQQASAA